MYRCLGKNYPNETGCFHKALPSVRSAYVTLQDFTPDLQQIYTDISAISVTFRNSGYLGVGRGTDHLTYGAIRKVYIYACLCHATQYHQAY